MTAHIAGLPAGNLPERVTPVAAVAMVKGLDADGRVQHYLLRTDGMTSVEAFGMHRAAAVLYEHAITGGGT